MTADQRLRAPERVWFGDGTHDAPPSVARIEDHLLGGFSNFTVDRDLADAVTSVWPALPAHTGGRRELLDRMTTRLVRAGVRQFLDVGSGLVRFDALHEITADHTTESVRVVYVDADPVAVLHNRTQLAGHPYTRSVCGDLCDPDTFLSSPELNDLLDFGEPVAVLLFGVLDHIPPDPGWNPLLNRILDHLSPGSYLGVTHLIPGPELAAVAEQVTALYARTPTSLHLRSHTEAARLWQDLTARRGLELLSPGLVPAHTWYPEPEYPPTRTPDLFVALTRVGPAHLPSAGMRRLHRHRNGPEPRHTHRTNPHRTVPASMSLDPSTGRLTGLAAGAEHHAARRTPTIAKHSHLELGSRSRGPIASFFDTVTRHRTAAGEPATTATTKDTFSYAHH